MTGDHKPIDDIELYTFERYLQGPVRLTGIVGVQEPMDLTPQRLVAEIRRLRHEAAEHHDELRKADDIASSARGEILRLRRLVDEFRRHWPLVVQALEEPKPCPMCRIDPLEDIMPPVRDERSPR